MTNEIAYKLGYWDAYFMGSTDTNIDSLTDEQFEMYRRGYYDGIDQYAKDNIIRKEAA